MNVHSKLGLTAHIQSGTCSQQSSCPGFISVIKFNRVQQRHQQLQSSSASSLKFNLGTTQRHLSSCSQQQSLLVCAKHVRCHSCHVCTLTNGPSHVSSHLVAHISPASRRCSIYSGGSSPLVIKATNSPVTARPCQPGRSFASCALRQGQGRHHRPFGCNSPELILLLLLCQGCHS